MPVTLDRLRRHSVRTFALCTVAVAGLVAAGCSAAGPSSGTASALSSPSTGTVLDNPLDAAVRDLPLTDQNGRRVSLGSLAGRTVVLTDFLTTCQEVCPMTSVNIHDAAQAVRAAGLGDSVVFLEITVDPDRDDPARLTAYQNLYGALPSWYLMTAGVAGTPALWKGLGVDYERTPPDSPPGVDWLTGKPLTYDVTHQDVVFVIDGRGHERWITQGTPSTGGRQPPASLGTFLNGEGRDNLSAPPQPSWTARDIEAAVSYVTRHRVG